MQDSKTLLELVTNDPEATLRHLARMQMYVEALNEAVKTWALSKGEYVSPNKTVKYQKRTRNIVNLDPEKAGPMLESQGYDLTDIAEVRLTEESIKAKLGELDGNKVISELISAGAVKNHTITYWRLQVK